MMYESFHDKATNIIPVKLNTTFVYANPTKYQRQVTEVSQYVFSRLSFPKDATRADVAPKQCRARGAEVVGCRESVA